jgi:hypothetical protein
VNNMIGDAYGGQHTSLVDVLKALGRDWRNRWEEYSSAQQECFDRYAGGRPKTPESEAAYARMLALSDAYWEHPVRDFARIVEQHGGPAHEIMEAVAWRINSNLGLAPLTRTRRPMPAVSDELIGIWVHDTDDQPDLPDLRWVYGALRSLEQEGRNAMN